jgi:hypothetical protein
MAWVRIPGAARQYQNTETGEILSRRQYDQRFGRLAKAGIKSNEAQALKNREENLEAQLARPARGRESVKKYSPETQRAILEGRKQFAKQKAETEATQKKIRAMKARANRAPKKVTDRLLQAGRIGKRYDVPLNYEAIHDAVSSARSAHVVAYGVGLNGIDSRNGQEISYWYRRSRFGGMMSIDDDFTRTDFTRMIEQANEKGYFVPVSAFVHFAFDKDYAASKKEKAIRQKRKQIFGNSI